MPALNHVGVAISSKAAEQTRGFSSGEEKKPVSEAFLAEPRNSKVLQSAVCLVTVLTS